MFLFFLLESFYYYYYYYYYSITSIDCPEGKSYRLRFSLVATDGKIKVIGKIGDFANSIQYNGCKLICSVDGAGTKTKFLEGNPERFRILGQDIVIHNINDMYCQNGSPIGMLDYFGCDKLDKTEFAEFITGVLEACKEYEIPLIGGETAEMTGIFQPGEIEVLGILLGIIPEGISGQNGGDRISKGNIIYGISSNGAHTNGYTKLRGIQDKMPEHIIKFFSQPHRSYVEIMNQIKTILGDVGIVLLGMAHITGGGFIDNITRIFPEGGDLHLELIGKSEWDMRSEWWWVYENSGMEWSEFLRVFNAGWGFCFITDKEIPDGVLDSILDGDSISNKKIKKLGWII
jgi:phosphoribosylformylglycinamidine cyclo-ligase